MQCMELKATIDIQKIARLTYCHKTKYEYCDLLLQSTDICEGIGYS